jgi:ribosomal protein L7Ae-like RNA K-turn-binding protein
MTKSISKIEVIKILEEAIAQSETEISKTVGANPYSLGKAAGLKEALVLVKVIAPFVPSYTTED